MRPIVPRIALGPNREGPVCQAGAKQAHPPTPCQYPIRLDQASRHPDPTAPQFVLRTTLAPRSQARGELLVCAGDLGLKAVGRPAQVPQDAGDRPPVRPPCVDRQRYRRVTGRGDSYPLHLRQGPHQARDAISDLLLVDGRVAKHECTAADRFQTYRDSGYASTPRAAARCETSRSFTPSGSQPSRCIPAPAGCTCNSPERSR